MREWTQPWITHKLSKMMARTITINNIHMPHWLCDKGLKVPAHTSRWQYCKLKMHGQHLAYCTLAATHCRACWLPRWPRDETGAAGHHHCSAVQWYPATITGQEEVKIHVQHAAPLGADHPLCVTWKLKALNWTDVRSGNVSIKITTGSFSFIIYFYPEHQ